MNYENWEMKIVCKKDSLGDRAEMHVYFNPVKERWQVSVPSKDGVFEKTLNACTLADAFDEASNLLKRYIRLQVETTLL